jgi:hypothetical protein
MPTLTSRNLATGVTKTDFIHIVITGDTSQSVDGSSYKATISQVQDIILIVKTSGITTSATTLVEGITYYGVNFSGNVDLDLFNISGVDGINLHIKDEGGTSGINRIRVQSATATIDGNPYVDINIPYMSLYLISRGGNWWII